MKMILLLLLSINAHAEIDCKKHSIYCHIKRVAPWLKQDKVMEMSNSFYNMSKKYKINAHYSIAIARQETTFGKINGRKESIIVFNEEMTEWKHYRGYSDICIFQFHANTIVNKGLDPIKLHTDLSYCIEEHFKLLQKKMKTCRKLGVKKEESWSCWHSFTPSKRKEYKKLTERYL